MYESFFGLRERPFSIAPDPRYLFMSQRHKEALAHLAYGIRQGAGFVLLTGEVGTGKTTVCRQILRKLPEHTQIAFILNPMLNALELLASLCDELGVDYSKDNYSLKQLTDNLTQHLLECHQQKINVVLMIDEAQNLATEVLEQIRLLTNLETDQKKLLQIILVGQPELQQLLARKELRQLAQRVTARYHLRPLDRQETEVYIRHRLRIAGSEAKLFQRGALAAIFRFTGGVPRLINNLCDRAMMAAFTEEKRQVSERIVKVAAEEVVATLNLDESKRPTPWFKWLAAPALMLVLAAGYLLGQGQREIGDASDKPVDKTVAIKAASSTTDSFKQVFEIDNYDPDGNIAAMQLARRWQVEFDRERDAAFCSYLSKYRMQCDQGFTSWRALIALNRPVNMRMENDRGQSSWLTLHQVVEEQAEIETLKGKQWLPLSSLLAMWSREYQLVWRAPPSYQKPLKRGDQNDQVQWLSERLSFVFSDPSIRDNRLFDQYIEALLIDYQEQHQLKADGIAGTQTLIHLNTSTVENIPRLFL